MAMEFLDKANTSILKAGYYDDPNNSSCKYHDIVLADDERIVGFKSGNRGTPYAYHHDF